MDHINILLEEYRTLRAEIINRTSNGYQLLAVGPAIPTGLFLWINWTRPATLPCTFWAVVGILVAAFLFLCFALYRDIILVARRLSKLELAINGLAGTTDLVWETNGGGGTVTQIIRRVGRKKSK